MKKIALALLLFTTPSFAQQQQASPAEAALQASNIVTQLGQIAAAQQKQIEALNAQVDVLRKQLEDAKKEKPADAK